MKNRNAGWENAIVSRKNRNVGWENAIATGSNRNVSLMSHLKSNNIENERTTTTGRHHVRA